MIEVKGDLWKYDADIRIITTNGYVKKSGAAVMDRGCTKEAADRFPNLPYLLGKAIEVHGNKVFTWPAFKLITFPVKHLWWQDASLNLIEDSTRQLMKILDINTSYVMPRAGDGKLDYNALVKPVLDQLPDNVFVITF
jgi:hypothetical protein